MAATATRCRVSGLGAAVRRLDRVSPILPGRGHRNGHYVGDRLALADDGRTALRALLTGVAGGVRAESDWGVWARLWKRSTFVFVGIGSDGGGAC